MDAEQEKRSLKEVMLNKDIEDFVTLNDSDFAELDAKNTEEEPGLAKVAQPKRVDLTKLAYYYVQGYDVASLATIFNVDRVHINVLKRSEKFKEILATLNTEIVATARTFLAASGLRAVRTLITCLDSVDARVKLKAATEILDRIGVRTPDQLEIIQKGDKLNSMDEAQLLDFVKLGMKELMPGRKEGANGGEQHKVTGVSEG